MPSWLCHTLSRTCLTHGLSQNSCRSRTRLSRSRFKESRRTPKKGYGTNLTNLGDDEEDGVVRGLRHNGVAFSHSRPYPFHSDATCTMITITSINTRIELLLSSIVLRLLSILEFAEPCTFCFPVSGTLRSRKEKRAIRSREEEGAIPIILSLPTRT